MRQKEQLNFSNWFAASIAAPRAFRTLSSDIDADICIVGATVAGLTAARDLASRGWSVVVLDGGTVGSDLFLPHLGLVAAGFPESLDRIIARVGVQRTQELWELARAGAAKVRSTITEANMPGVSPIEGELVVQVADDMESAQRRAAQLRFFGAEAEAWPTEQVRAALKADRYFQAVHRADAFHIHPVNYVVGLASAAEEAGARIFERARVASIDAAGVRKRVQAEGGQIRASHIVLAKDDDNQRLHSPIAGTTISLVRHFAATSPLDAERATSGSRFKGLVTEAILGGTAHRRDGDRLLWASPLSAWPSAPWAFVHRMRWQIRKTYPGLSPLRFTQRWTARAAFSAQKMPQVGEVAPGLWLLGAFGDNPIAAATMAGGLTASAIHEGDDRWRLFSSFGLGWAGGIAAKAVLGVVLPGLRVASRVRALVAPAQRTVTPASIPAPPLLALPPPDVAAEELPEPEAGAAIPLPPPPEETPKKPVRRSRKKVNAAVGDANAAAPPRKAPRPKKPASPADVLQAKPVRKPRAPRAPASAAKANGHDSRPDPEPGNA